MAEVSVTVSVADDATDRFGRVVERLREAGLNVEQELEGINVVTGTVDAERIESLGEVEDVSHVEEAREDIRIPPPDSDIQ